MSEKSIWVARHGQTEWNKEGRYQGRKNSPLTEQGVAQAWALAKFLQDKNIAEIYVSPLERAQQTAAIVQALLAVKMTVMPELAEMSFGSFEGQTKAETQITHPDFYLARQNKDAKVGLAYPDGESYENVWERLAQPILGLLKLNQEILLVAHNSVNKVIRGLLLGQSLPDVMDHDQKNHQVIQVWPGLQTEKVHDVQN